MFPRLTNVNQFWYTALGTAVPPTGNTAYVQAGSEVDQKRWQAVYHLMGDEEEALRCLRKAETYASPVLAKRY
jgi:hypothetical protein